MRKTYLVIFAAMCLFSNQVQAQDKDWDQAAAIEKFETCYANSTTKSKLMACDFTQDCMQSGPSGTTSLGMHRCSKMSSDIWDGKLNMEYKQLMSHLGPSVHDDNDPVKGLQDAQRAWIAYRDAECWSQYGRSAIKLGAIRTSCINRMTRERTIEFNEQNAWHNSR